MSDGGGGFPGGITNRHTYDMRDHLQRVEDKLDKLLAISKKPKPKCKHYWEDYGVGKIKCTKCGKVE